MITEDFYSGEPVQTGSPPFSDDKSQEYEAASMASFGKYDYDPSRRVTNQIYPGQTGYTPYHMCGLGNPVLNQPLGYINPVQPTYNQFRPYYQQPQQVQQPKTCHIAGVGSVLNGEFMPPADFDERIEKMKAEYISKQIDIEAKEFVDRKNSIYNNGYFGTNYYGMSYYNPYQYNSLNAEISKQVEAMKDEARENRMAFNLNLSKLAHNIAKDGIDSSAIEERYRGRDVNIPTAIVQTPQEYYEYARLANMVPVDNSQQYRDFEASVNRSIREALPENANLEETFKGMNLLMAQWEMEEELHRRRDGSGLYNSKDNAYKHFLRKKAEQRYAVEKGINLPPALVGFDAQQARKDFIASSPLSQVSKLADDGTLEVNLTLPCNVGSKAGQMYSCNSNESAYEEKRQRFASFLNSIPSNSELDAIKQRKLDSYDGS